MHRLSVDSESHSAPGSGSNTALLASDVAVSPAPTFVSNSVRSSRGCVALRAGWRASIESCGIVTGKWLASALRVLPAADLFQGLDVQSSVSLGRLAARFITGRSSRDAIGSPHLARSTPHGATSSSSANPPKSAAAWERLDFVIVEAEKARNAT